jgi:hypothetical protein
MSITLVSPFRRLASPEPFFQVTGADRHRRLLLISPHFPPSQAAGALRWQKLSRHAAERGWGIDVVTIDPSSLGPRDPSRLEELPDSTRVFGVPTRRHWVDRLGALITTLARVTRKRSGGGGNGTTTASHGAPRGSVGRAEATFRLRSPSDLRRAVHAWLEYATEGRWARDAGRLACQLYNSHHAAVITCGPPHMAHRAGARVQRATRLPFVMDMRDPWSLVERLPAFLGSPVWWRLAERHERKVLARAALVVVNTKPHREALGRSYPEARDRIIAVLNGYDDDPLPPSRHNARFTIAYAGTIYLDRDPGPLFKAAAAAVRDLDLTPTEFGIELMGSVQEFDGVSIQSIAQGVGLADFVRTRPPGTRAEALDFLAEATMLVSLPQDSDLAIPSKVFEYMRYDAWVLALAERGSATEEVLRDSGADVVGPTDVTGISKALRARILQHRAGERPPRLRGVDQYSRREQAKVLFDRLDALIS